MGFCNVEEKDSVGVGRVGPDLDSGKPQTGWGNNANSPTAIMAAKGIRRNIKQRKEPRGEDA